MPERIPALVAAFGSILALAFHAGAFAQIAAAPQALPPATVTVQQLAPQLLAFAGSAANFQSLVNGLAQGLPVTLITTNAQGLTQSISFTPTGTMSAVDVARVLEQARQNLIARGISAPSAEQLGVALTGGSLATALGPVAMSPLVQVGTGTQAGTAAPAATTLGTSAAGIPANRPGAASAGSSVSSNVPAATSAAGTATGTGTTDTATVGTRAAQPRFTSDNASRVGTSDTPLPLTSGTPAATIGTSNSPLPATSATTGAVTAAPSPNGAPSPAAQMQGRR